MAYRHSLLLAAALLTSGAVAQKTRLPFDPSRLKGPQHGIPNEVMVLGSPHLSDMPATFRPIDLSGLIDRLASWSPQAIAIEALSGAQCDFLRHYPDRYRDTVAAYCWDPAPARGATGLDVPAATAAWERLLAAWPASPTPAQRRTLAALFLAGGEPASALVQWLRLPVGDRRAGDSLDAALVARLTLMTDRHNESFLIAAPLAARLGQDRVYAMDDHTADAPVTDEAGYGAAIGKAWDNPATKTRTAMSDRWNAKLGSADGVLALYRAINAPSMARLAFDSDFGAALEEPSVDRFGRQYVGYWETRNLRMASNIRDMLGSRPGIRALVIVGASHKPYLDAYLNQSHDIRIEDVLPVLR